MTRSLAESLRGHSPDEWALDFLHVAGFEPTPENMRAVVSWEYAESGAGGGFYNPLNTTQGGFSGETDFNSVGVKNYRTYSDGVAANAKVLHNGFYPHVVAAFADGTSAERIVSEITRSPWGTRHIQLIGTPVPVPVPRKVEPMFVPSPHATPLKGRVAAAWWQADAPNQVTLTNGARIAHDVPNQHGIHVWRPPLTPGRVGVGIFPTIGHDGRPDGKGVVFQDDAADTYTGLWS